MANVNNLKGILERTKENLKLMMMTENMREAYKTAKQKAALYEMTRVSYASMDGNDEAYINDDNVNIKVNEEITSNPKKDVDTNEQKIEKNTKNNKDISIKVNLSHGEIVVSGYLPVYKEKEEKTKLEKVQIRRPFRGTAANGMYTKTYDKSEIRYELQLENYVKEYVESYYGKSNEEDEKYKDAAYLKEIENVKADIRKNFTKNFDMGVYKTLIDYDMRKLGSPINDEDSYTYRYIKAISAPVTREEGETLRDYKIRKNNTVISRLNDVGISIEYDLKGSNRNHILDNIYVYRAAIKYKNLIKNSFEVSEKETDDEECSKYAPLDNIDTQETPSTENNKSENVTNNKSLSKKFAIVLSKLKLDTKKRAYTAKKSVSDKIKKLSSNSNVQLKKKIALAVMGAAATTSVIVAANGLIGNSYRTNNSNKQYVFEDIKEPITDNETIITGYRVNENNIVNVDEISVGNILTNELNAKESSAENINNSKILELNDTAEDSNNMQSDIESISENDEKEEIAETIKLGSTFKANNLHFYEGPKEDGRMGKVSTQEMKIDIIDVMDENGNLVGIYRTASGDEVSIDELKEKYGDSAQISCHVSKSKDGQVYQDAGWAYLTSIEKSIDNNEVSQSVQFYEDR